jgi:sortase B
MDDGSMFQPIVKYKDQSYYDQNPIMYYLTPEGNFRLELFAGLVVHRDDPVYRLEQNTEEFQKLLTEYKQKSTFLSSVEWEEGDTIVTLSTCSYEYNHAIYIVVGKLVPIHE